MESKTSKDFVISPTDDWFYYKDAYEPKSDFAKKALEILGPIAVDNVDEETRKEIFLNGFFPNRPQ